MPSTYTSLNYHIVFSTKERMPFITGPLLKPMHAYLGGVIRNMGGVPLQTGGVADHVHVLARLKTTHCVADVMRDMKKASSDWARNEMKCRDFHWQDGYGAFTVSSEDCDRVREYILGQWEHHHGRTFADEYRELLAGHTIEFDERFLL